MRRDGAGALARVVVGNESGAAKDALSAVLPALLGPAADNIRAAIVSASSAHPQDAVAFLLLARAAITEALNAAAIIRSRS